MATGTISKNRNQQLEARFIRLKHFTVAEINAIPNPEAGDFVYCSEDASPAFYRGSTGEWIRTIDGLVVGT